MEFASNIRCFSSINHERFEDEKHETITSKEQLHTENLVKKCFERFEQLASLDPTLPKLYRKEHIRYLESALNCLSSAYECLDSSRPWLIYWILNGAYLLDFTFSDNILSNVVDFLVKCRSLDGGFGGGPGQYPHLAPTYAAVNSLCIIGTNKAFAAIDKVSLKKFLWSVREENGAFRMHVNGELDVRGAYCAISSAKLANFNKLDENELFKNTSEWIVSCQTYEGGFGGTPDLEAHGGYTFCATAALALLGTISGCNMSALLRWTVNRQMRYEGGFQGRTNKLVDGCYSFWQAANLPIVQAIINKIDSSDMIKQPLFYREALQEYVLICCQKSNGGLIDKPGKPADLYHTCYTLSGLSVSQHCEKDTDPLIVGHPDNELLPTHPLHNIPPKAVIKAYMYFQQNDHLLDEHIDSDDGNDMITDNSINLNDDSSDLQELNSQIEE